MVVFRKLGEVIVPPAGPLTFVQVPMPTLGTFPAMVAEPEVEQIVWLEPALAAVGEITVTEAATVRAQPLPASLTEKYTVYVPFAGGVFQVNVLAAEL